MSAARSTWRPRDGCETSSNRTWVPSRRSFLDLSEVEFMDSYSLKVPVQARSRLTENGGSLILRNPSSAAHRLLTVAGANDLLETDAQDHPSDSN
jgi:anti-anti-sigma factor